MSGVKEKALHGSEITIKASGLAHMELCNSLVCKDQKTSVWIFGDFGAGRSYTTFADIVECDTMAGEYLDKFVCFDKVTDLTITFFSHQPPKYALTKRLDNFTGVPDFIQSLPRDRKHILLIHYYIHYTAAHLSVLSLRMRKLREGIDRMLEAIPNLLVDLIVPLVTSTPLTSPWVGIPSTH